MARERLWSVGLARDGEEVNLGDIAVQPGHRIRGKVTLSDGAQIANLTRVSITAEKAWDTQTVQLAPDGYFEFSGVSAGNYQLFASARGYQAEITSEVVEVDRDIDNFVLALTRRAGRKSGSPEVGGPNF